MPDFVWQQSAELKKNYPQLSLMILAPHHAGSKTSEQWNGISIRRFRYFFPDRLQLLVYPAIWPNIQHNPVLVLLVPFLLILEFIATLLNGATKTP